MKSRFILALLLCSIVASAQVYVYKFNSLVSELENTPDSVVTIPLYRTPLPAVSEGALPGVFSVSKTRKVRFSKGNLQYLNASHIWQFAEHQYETAGGDISGAVIDQFGLGTSGWAGSNAPAYLPTDTTTSDEAYGGVIGGTVDYSLVGYMQNRDWGIYNPIANGGNQPGLWRTPTNQEWNYLFSSRWTPYAIAIVNGVWGIVVLPDGWDEEPTLKLRPCYFDKNWKSKTTLTEAEIQEILALCNNDTLSYEARSGAAMTSDGKRLDIAFYSFMPGYDYTIQDDGAYATWADRPIEDYSITPEEWQAYEAKGCVFLPFQKSRSNPENTERWAKTEPAYLQSCTYVCPYWTSTATTSVLMNYIYNTTSPNQPYQFIFRSGTSAWYPFVGGCVRLVQDY